MATVFTLETIQEDVLEAIEEAVEQRVVEQAIEDVETVLRTAEGDIDPYYAVHFGDIAPGRTRSMAGAWGDDYRLPFYVLAVAPTGKIVRQMNNVILAAILGETFDYSGNIRKRPGGVTFVRRNASGSVEAYVGTTSYDLDVQLAITEEEEP